MKNNQSNILRPLRSHKLQYKCYHNKKLAEISSTKNILNFEEKNH